MYVNDHTVVLLKDEEQELPNLRTVAMGENEALHNHVITVGNYVGIIKSKVLKIYSTYLITILVYCDSFNDDLVFKVSIYNFITLILSSHKKNMN